MLFHCSVELHFCTNEWYLASFHVPVGHLEYEPFMVVFRSFAERTGPPEICREGLSHSVDLIDTCHC